MKAAINGIELYFDVEGAGLVPDGPRMQERIPCFALHGGPALDHTYFKPWLTPLTDVFQFIYVDHRGTGRSSEAPPDTYRLPQMADDLEALRRHLGLDRVAVMGSSYGGFLAQTYALAYPESVRLLLLLGTAPSYRFWDTAAVILAEKGTPEQNELGPTLLEGRISTLEEYRHWWKTMLPLYFYAYDPADEQVVDRIIGNPRTSQEMFHNDMPYYDVVPRLGEIAAPTFVACGEHDWITPPGESRLIAENVQNGELFLYDKSGHFLFAEEHERFLADVRGFVARHTTPTYESAEVPA
jgi:proline iminopeptidase